MKTKPLFLAIAILIVIFGTSLIFQELKKGGLIPSSVINFLNPGAQKAGEKAIEYLNKNLLGPDRTAALESASDEGSVYKIVFKINGEPAEAWLSKDGKFIFPTAIELAPISSPESNPAASAPKAEKPDVKLFVMSYCPYGLQAEKAYLPVYNLLKNKADFGIYFVSYAMHEKQEVDENLRQYCVQKDNKEKFAGYLDCFTKTGQAESCLTEAKIDKNSLNSCISQTDSQFKITANYNDKETWTNGNYPPFNIHKDLNEKYKVQGSPTIIINDQEVSLANRSAEALKTLVCQAFNTAPQECAQKLSETQAGPGFGESTDAAGANAAGCAQ